jgi:hypothetical protein
MFAITSKVKIAAGIAAGLLSVGAAGAYAANANSTITVENPKAVTLGSGSNTLSLISLDGSTPQAPADGFKNAGECTSWLAKNKNLALAPQGTLGSSVKLAKNYHGKLMSSANAWCKTQVTEKTKTDAADAEASDATDAAKAHGNAQGNGKGKGHAKHASEND